MSLRIPSWIFKASLITAMAGGLLALLAIPGLRPRDLLLQRLLDDLDVLPEPRLHERLEQIACLGSAGTTTLVDAMSNRPESVAAAAGDVLLRQLDRWRLHTGPASSRHVAHLAAELARHVEQMDERRRDVAAELAMRILLWPLDKRAADSATLIADCQRVLEASGETSSGGRFAGAASPAKEGPATPLALAGSLPGGNIPIAALPLPPLPPLDTARPVSVSMASENTSDSDHTDPGRGAIVPGAVEDSSESETDAVLAAHRQLQMLEDLELIRYLHSDLGGLARLELTRRGFTAFEFQLAERLTHPDPEVRLQLAESLPQASSFDARPWLLALSRDEEPRVRLAAIAIMATSHDAAIRSRLREIAPQETDPDIVAQLRRLFGTKR